MNKTRIVSLTPLLWLIYFGLLFKTYYVQLNIGGIGGSYLTSLTEATEYQWRLIWGLFSISLILISSISLMVSLKIIYYNTTKFSNIYRWLLSSGLAICIILIVALFLNFGIGGGAVVEFLRKAGQKTDVNIQKIVDMTMALSASATFLISTASCSILIHPESISVEYIKKQYNHFKTSFYTTSIFLGIGILQVYLLFTWASHAVGKNPAALKMSQALTISGSIIYTIIFMSFFIPVSIILSTWLRAVAEKDIQNRDDPKYIEWRKSVGLYNTPGTNIKNLLVLLSPVLIGIFVNVVSKYIT